MNQFKRAQVIILPTKDNPTPISISNNSKTVEYHQFLFGKKKGIYNNHIFQQLYIISDDEIKESNWIYCDYSNTIHQDYQMSKKECCKKIIATTDTSLKLSKPFETKDWGTLGHSLISFPQPSQQFIEKYIESYNKGEVITDVLVEYETYINIDCKMHIDNSATETVTKQQNLRVNPKDNTITIKKLKNSWNREEVGNLIKLFANNYRYASNDIGYNKWIEENL